MSVNDVARPEGRSRARWILPGILGAVTIWRIWISAATGLGDAEAYYWTWSRELSLGYLDHGPLVALLVRLGTHLIGDTPLGVRLPFVLLSTVTLFFLADTAARLARDPRAGPWSAATLIAMPAYLIAGGAANPDGPYAFLCVLSLRALLAIAKRHAEAPLRQALRFALAGLLVGLAIDAKLLGASLLPVPIGAAFVLGSGSILSRLWCALAALGAAALGALPVLIWNHAHGWASLGYHLVARHTRPAGLSLENLGKLVGGQLAYASPIVCVGLGAALLTLVRRRHDPGQAVLLAASLALLLPGYLLILLIPGAEPHWPMAGYLPLAIALGGMLPGALRSNRAVRWWTCGALGFTLLATALLQLHVMSDVGVRALAAAGWYRGRLDLGNELRGWPRVADELARFARPDSRVAGAHYTTCSQLAFAARGRFRVVCPSARLDQFDFQPGGDGSRLRGVELLYVKDDRFPHDAHQLYRCLGGVEPVAAVELSRARRVVRRFELQRCRRFAGLAHTTWPPPGGPR